MEDFGFEVRPKVRTTTGTITHLPIRLSYPMKSLEPYELLQRDICQVLTQMVSTIPNVTMIQVMVRFENVGVAINFCVSPDELHRKHVLADMLEQDYPLNLAMFCILNDIIK